MTRSDLHAVLRSLDPAEMVRPDDPARAAADLDSIVATDPSAPWPPSPPVVQGGRRRWTPPAARGRLALAGAALAAVLTGAVVLAPLPGGDPAFASWTAAPSGLSSQERKEAADSCRDTQTGGADAEDSERLRRARPAVAERRGTWTTVLLAGADGFSALCITDAAGWSFDRAMIGAVGVPVDWTPPGPRELTATSLGVGTLSGGELSLVAGGAGSQVAGVVYRSRDHGDVRATLSLGHFALWLPGDELAGASSEGVEVAVTYRDGSTRNSRLTL